MKVSVVLPAYNEAENLPGLLPKIYQQLGEDAEVIVVDDASSDETSSVAVKYGARVLKNPCNMGNGASVKRGIRLASNDIVVLMDADGQHKPNEIIMLIEGLDKYDMVVGARPACGHVWYRRIANTFYNMLASYVSGVRIVDLTSGFRAFRRDKAMKFLYLLPNTFSYPSTLTMAFIKAAYPVGFKPINILPRSKGKSKINLLNDGLRFFIIIMKIAVFFSPLKLFLPIAFFFFLTGSGYYIYTFTAYHRFTNMSALLITTSVIIFMLGLISEQIANLRMEKAEDN
ncbi:MAG: glycosyltransferase family 2 protein [Candidatus Omnitrophota bacterium]